MIPALIDLSLLPFLLPVIRTETVTAYRVHFRRPPQRRRR